MALFIVSLFVLAPFSLLLLDLTGRGRKAPAQGLAPSYGERLQQTAQPAVDLAAPSRQEPVAA